MLHENGCDPQPFGSPKKAPAPDHQTTAVGAEVPRRRFRSRNKPGNRTADIGVIFEQPATKFPNQSGGSGPPTRANLVKAPHRADSAGSPSDILSSRSMQYCSPPLRNRRDAYGHAISRKGEIPSPCARAEHRDFPWPRLIEQSRANRQQVSPRFRHVNQHRRMKPLRIFRMISSTFVERSADLGVVGFGRATHISIRSSNVFTDESNRSPESGRRRLGHPTAEPLQVAHCQAFTRFCDNDHPPRQSMRFRQRPSRQSDHTPLLCAVRHEPRSDR